MIIFSKSLVKASKLNFIYNYFTVFKFGNFNQEILVTFIKFSELLWEYFILIIEFKCFDVCLWTELNCSLLDCLLSSVFLRTRWAWLTLSPRKGSKWSLSRITVSHRCGMKEDFSGFLFKNHRLPIGTKTFRPPPRKENKLIFDVHLSFFS